MVIKVNEKLEEKTVKCEKLVKRIGDLETRNGDLDNVQSKLKQKVITKKVFFLFCFLIDPLKLCV